MPLKIQGKDIRLRLASVPHGGFDMVMRISTQVKNVINIRNNLGYTAQPSRYYKNGTKITFRRNHRGGSNGFW